jgi:hypothetical protein
VAGGYRSSKNVQNRLPTRGFAKEKIKSLGHAAMGMPRIRMKTGYGRWIICSPPWSR